MSMEHDENTGRTITVMLTSGQKIHGVYEGYRAALDGSTIIIVGEWRIRDDKVAAYKWEPGE